MSGVLFCLTLLVGVCAWGFLLAAALTFYDPERPEIRGWGWSLFMVDLFISLGLFTMLFIIVRNWKRRPEARKLLYTGCCFLACAIGLGSVWFLSGV